jgi:predicted ArsR family transcriptional regulator
MKNTPGPEPAGDVRLVPLPSTPRAAIPALPRARAALLRTLEELPRPATLAEVAAATGLHPNTVREHAEALIRDGLVRRSRTEPNGRGRPAWRYEPVPAAPDPETTEYVGLAASLAAFISRTSDSPREDAVAAGAEWGHTLARGRAATRSGDATARRRVLTLLDELGFAPEDDGADSTVRLTRCPLLETAEQYPDVVCGVHLGLVRGALQEYGADPAGTDLVPFAEPGACLLDLPITAADGDR